MISFSLSSLRGGGGGICPILHKLMKTFSPEIFFDFTQRPGEGVTLTTGTLSAALLGKLMFLAAIGTSLGRKSSPPLSTICKALPRIESSTSRVWG